MKIEDVLELTRAGYTKDEILKLSQIEEPKEEIKETPKEEPKEKTTPIPTQTTITTDLTAKLDEILKAVQTGNILRTNNTVPKQETIEDILTQIVDPTPKK